MPATSTRTPSYRLHKASGQAVVSFGGRDTYLGKHGSPESRAEYDRLIAEWLANGRRLGGPNSPSDLTVNELLAAYLRHAEGYYVKDGEPTSEVKNIGLALRPVRTLFGHTLATSFGPQALKTVRDQMVASGLCRNEVNKRVRHVVRAFKWGVGEEMVPASVHHCLKAVDGLRRGRSAARETEPVKPVPEAHVDAVRPHVSRQVWAMIELQRLTAMRPGEVRIMRTCDVDVSGKIWVYTPSRHKTAHHGKERKVYFGPRAQAVLRPWLRTNLIEYLFSPAEAESERRAEQRAARKSRVQPSQKDRKKRKPWVMPGDLYEAYGRAIARACDKAGVPRWHPHRLRHNAATRLRREFGIDAARAVLGHSSTAVTEIYAELDMAKAVAVMPDVG